MKAFYHGKSQKGGVYKITCTANGRAYIGSAAKFKDRFWRHRKDLVENKHHCKFLQRDWNKLKPENFIFEILEVVSGSPLKEAKEQRLSTEQVHIDQQLANFPRKYLYNGYTNVRDYPYVQRTAEFKKKMKAFIKDYYSDPKNVKVCSDAAKKRWDNHSADITVTRKKTGETVTIDGSIRSFCEERGLSYKAFHLMVQGKTKSSGDWYLGTKEPDYVERKGEKRKPLSSEHRAKIAGGKYAGVVLKHKVSGETFVIGKNAKADCGERGISYSSFQKMLNNKCKSASGWIKNPNLDLPSL